MKYWDNPEVFRERNKQIVKDKASGMSILEISVKHGLSSTRIFAILARARRKNESK